VAATPPPIAAVPSQLFSAGDFLADIDDADLVYFLLNVGDGDAQVILLPAEKGVSGPFRRAMVVDVADAGKLSALIETLHTTPAANPLFARAPGNFPVVVGTHPHDDHIGGMSEFLDAFATEIGEYWDPGYYHTSAEYMETMTSLETHPSIQYTQPTSGMTRFLGNVRITVLSPGIGLRNRFDSYGVELNNASISLKVEFPASRVEQRGKDRLYVRIRDTQALILGGDAQTLSWSQVLVDFPDLEPDNSPIAKQLRMALGNNPLSAQVFKVPHHASKHGVNLELVELISPAISLVSSVAGGGKYNFPHMVAQESLREGLQATTGKGTEHKPDHELGIHYTSAKDSKGATLGTIGLVMSPTGKKRHLWRFGDDRDQDVDLSKARLFKS
jgi:hypothetical protein